MKKRIVNEDRFFATVILLVLLIIMVGIGTIESRMQDTIDTQYLDEQDKIYQDYIDTLKSQLMELQQELHKVQSEIEEVKEIVPIGQAEQLHLFKECAKYNIPIQEAAAIMKVENSQFDPVATNHNKNGTTDWGLFQINDVNLKSLKAELGITNLTDAKQNISAGVYILSELGQKYTGHEKYMAYNMGVGGMKKAVSRGILTTAYSRRVLQLAGKN